MVHVTPTAALAQKCEAAGCDAVVVEGFEAGGHNGYDELTTMVLVPQARDAVKIPVIAAGGIADGRQMAAALALGADAVQIGSRFAASAEAACHEHFKQAIVKAGETDTMLALRKLEPTRLLKNPFYAQVKAAAWPARETGQPIAQTQLPLSHAGQSCRAGRGGCADAGGGDGGGE